MNKFLSIALLFSSISYADIDIGDDFEVGGLVSAEAFNLKFGKLKKVVGEITDEDYFRIMEIGSAYASNNRLATQAPSHD